MKKTPKKITINDLANTIDNLARMVVNGFEDVKNELRGEFKEGFEELRGEMRAGFKKVNERVDNHIAQTAEGFEDVGKRFDSFEAGTHRRLTLVETSVKGIMEKEVSKK